MNTTQSETEQVLFQVGSMLEIAEGFTEICGPSELLLFDADTRLSLISLQSLLTGAKNFESYLSPMMDGELSEQTVQVINSEVSATISEMRDSLTRSSMEISTSEMQKHLVALDLSLSRIFTHISSELGMLN